MHQQLPSPRETRYHRTGGLGLAVVAVSGVVAAGILGSVVLRHPAEEAIARSSVTGEPAGGLAALWVLSALLLVPAVTVAGLLTGTWLTTARANAVRIEPHRVRRAAVWAWLGWIFPLVLLGLPRQIVDDVLSVTDRSTSSRTGLWWWSWIGVLLAATAGSLVTLAGDTAFLAPALDAVTAVLVVVALLAWAGVVRRVDAASRALVRLGRVPVPVAFDPLDRFAPAPNFSGATPLSLTAFDPAPSLFDPAPAPLGALPPQRG